MATVVLRSQDCLKGFYHLEAFGSRPPPAAKSHRRKASRPSPLASHPPSSPPKPRQRQLVRSPPPTTTSSPAKPLGSAAGNPQLPSRKSRSPSKESAPDGDGQAKRALVIEEVRILKRGEVLRPAGEDRLPDGSDAALCSTNRIGPEPDILPKKLGLAGVGSVYAGLAFFASPSPSPSSLPIPGFLKSDAATKSLRSALRLVHLQ